MKIFTKTNFRHGYAYLLLSALIVAVGAFGYADYSSRRLEQEDAVDVFEEYLPHRCENGEWIDFPELESYQQYGKFSGKEKFKYDEGQGNFFSADGRRKFLTDAEYSLFFFIDREAEVDGYKLKNGDIYVRRIKCVGAEANQKVVFGRKELMQYFQENINAVAPEKASGNDWQVETFYFVNDTDVYVQYETPGSFAEETAYDSRLWLVRVSGWKEKTPLITTLAYIQEDVDDSEKNIVKQGEDIYRNEKNMIIYEFDDEMNQWMLQ